jgi:hypothetical protein
VTPEVIDHLLNGFWSNTEECSAPSCVNDPYDRPVWIDQKDGDAIGGQYTDGNSGLIRHQGIRRMIQEGT